MNGMREYAMRMAKTNADESWLPQTVVQYDDPDFPFRSFWYGYRDFDSRTLDVSTEMGWRAIVTMLPDRWFRRVENA